VVNSKSTKTPNKKLANLVILGGCLQKCITPLVVLKVVDYIVLLVGCGLCSQVNTGFWLVMIYEVENSLKLSPPLLLRQDNSFAKTATSRKMIIFSYYVS
jgi:hypothetical protein